MKWVIHRVNIKEKIQNQQILSIDFAEINLKKIEQRELLFLLCKRGIKKDLIGEYYEYSNR